MAKKTNKKKLILLDSHAIIHRAYHALPEFMNSRGEPTGAIYGLATMLFKIITDLKPDYIVACFDLSGPTYRHEAYGEYKAGRKKTDDNLSLQLESAKDLFKDQVGYNLNENVIIVESGDENFFLNKLDEIKDLDERIILSKNIEEYSINLFNKLKDKRLIIFSGDVDRCEFGDQLVKKDFKTKIFFTYPEKMHIEGKIELPKYSGHILSDKYNGLISILK
jgi:5'-3' exonuclease